MKHLAVWILLRNPKRLKKSSEILAFKLQVHGKAAVIDREHVKKYGAWFGESYCVHRFPGLGECDWSEIIQMLSEYGYKSDICIEGFHDPVYCGEREYEGQLATLTYLKKCRESA